MNASLINKLKSAEFADKIHLTVGLNKAANLCLEIDESPEVSGNRLCVNSFDRWCRWITELK